MSSRDTDDECLMHSKSENKEITINDKADEFIEELFKSIFLRCQRYWEKSRSNIKIAFYIIGKE